MRHRSPPSLSASQIIAQPRHRRWVRRTTKMHEVAGRAASRRPGGHSAGNSAPVARGRACGVFLLQHVPAHHRQQTGSAGQILGPVSRDRPRGKPTATPWVLGYASGQGKGATLAGKPRLTVLRWGRLVPKTSRLPKRPTVGACEYPSVLLRTIYRDCVHRRWRGR
jgi:hypothetical protein